MPDTDEARSRVAELVRELQNEHAWRRESAVEDLGRLAIKDATIKPILKTVADTDPNRFVRNQAKEILTRLASRPSINIKPPASRKSISLDEIIPGEASLITVNVVENPWPPHWLSVLVDDRVTDPISAGEKGRRYFVDPGDHTLQVRTGVNRSAKVSVSVSPNSQISLACRITIDPVARVADLVLSLVAGLVIGLFAGDVTAFMGTFGFAAKPQIGPTDSGGLKNNENRRFMKWQWLLLALLLWGFADPWVYYGVSSAAYWIHDSSSFRLSHSHAELIVALAVPISTLVGIGLGLFLRRREFSLGLVIAYTVNTLLALPFLNLGIDFTLAMEGAPWWMIVFGTLYGA